LKIVITGPTGFVGRQLVPVLIRAGATLLLVARNPAYARRLFPGVAACGLDELDERGRGFDTLVHLSVLNNDASASDDEFRRVNVDLLMETLEAADKAGIPRFVNVSSVHALEPGNHTAYARTKREAAARVRDVASPVVTTVYMPPVHGTRYGGKLYFLNRFPSGIARRLLHILSAFRPVLDVAVLADFIVAGMPDADLREVVLSDGQHGNNVYLSTKRTIDVVASVLFLATFWWLLAIIWALVRMQSSGPAIFAQTRVGLHGREFTLYKFRTMKLGTPHTASHEASAGAITRLGHFLRRTKLDELPQLWNVVRNEVSLVGPRPCLPSQSALVEARKRRGVLALKPGITGLAQVNGVDMREPEYLAKWDARYLALRSIVLDVKICIATALGGGGGDAVTTPGRPERKGR
jgi:lipopolysaccharide/colanic/teichoic acid biosynthesis glycosyltransferase